MALMRDAPAQSCPSTAERLVIGGANDVCGPPGTAAPAFRAGTLVLAASLAIAVALTMTRRSGVSRAGLGVLLLGAAVVAAPGARALLVDRADAPLRVGATASTVANLLGDLDGYVSEHHGCVAEIHDDCLACQPLLRFVVPRRVACARRDGRIDLAADTLASALPSPASRPCAVEQGALECGHTP